MQNSSDTDFGKLLRVFVRLVVLGVVLAVMIAAGGWLLRVFNTGTLTVMTTSSTNNNIMVTKLQNGTLASTAAARATGKLTTKLPAGQYVITVQGPLATTNEIITLRGRQNVTYSVNPASPASSEPVANTTALTLSVDNSNLYYVNASGTDLSASSGLYMIDGKNALHNDVSAVPLTSVAWVRTGYGVGRGLDQQLYVVNGSSETFINTPRTSTPLTNVPFAVTPDGHMYLASSDALYYGTIGGNLTKIYSLSTLPSLLAASSSEVAVIYKTSVSAVNKQGKLIKTMSVPAQPAYAAWSPDGSKLALSTTSSGQIVDASLRQIVPLPVVALSKLALLPTGTVSDLSWIGNTRLVYGINNQLWLYDVGKGEDSLLAVLNNNMSVDEVDADANGQYAYFVAHNTSATSIERVGLAGQSVPAAAATLQAVFPKTVGPCFASYINFTHPTIYAVTDNSEVSACRQAMSGELASDGLQNAGITVNFIPVPPSAQGGP